MLALAKGLVRPLEHRGREDRAGDGKRLEVFERGKVDWDALSG
jgi:hypothetical protein